jgi:thioredoxin 1
MTTINLTQENFHRMVSEHDMLVVDFWAPWCAPCRFFSPVFEAAAEQHTDIAFGKINTDEQQELASMFGIRSIPTLMIMREKVVLYHEAGALPAKALDDVLEKARTIDMAKVHEELARQPQDAEQGEAAGEAGSGPALDPVRG